LRINRSIQTLVWTVFVALSLAGCDGGISGDDLSGNTPILVDTNSNRLSPYHLDISPAVSASSATPTISGFASPNDQVKLYATTHCTGSVIQTGTADASGVFSLISTALASEGLQKFSVKAFHTDGTSDCSASYVSYLYDKTGPMVSSFPIDQTVGAFPASIQFGLGDALSGLANLSVSNTNGELTFGGCGDGSLSDQPTATIDISHKPLFTAHLSGGNCIDGDLLTVTLHGNKLIDSIGNAGSGDSVVNYRLALNAPTVNLTRQDGLDTPISSSSTLVVNVDFTHAAGGTTTLVSDATNAGAQVLLFGSSTGCHANVQMGAGMVGGTISITGCTSNGSLMVIVANTLVRNAASVAGTGNTILNLIVDNTGPSLTHSLVATNDYVGSLDGSNQLSFIVNDANAVQALSADNSGGEFIVGGSCAIPPNLAVASTDGSNYTVTLSGGTCADGDSVTVSLDPSKILDTSGNADTLDTSAAQTIHYTIDSPAGILVEIGGDTGNPTTPGSLVVGAPNLVIYLNKNLTGGNAHLYCGVDYSSLVEVTLSAATFGTDGTVKWLVSEIQAANSSDPFPSGTVCNMDISGLVDSHGVRVDGAGTSILSSFSIP
jgi:hypothetical protein